MLSSTSRILMGSSLFCVCMLSNGEGCLNIKRCWVQKSNNCARALTRKGFVGILECCPDDMIKERGVTAGSTIDKDILLTMGAPTDLGFVADLIEKLLSEFAGWFECDHHVKRDKEILHLRHDLGKKWSLYLTGAAQGICKSVLKKDVDVEMTDSSVTMTINK